MRDLPLPTLPIFDLSVRITPRGSLRPGDASPCNPPLVPIQLEATWARDENDVREAQQLRYRLYAADIGAAPRLTRFSPPQHDADIFDPFCEHLLVRAVVPEAGPGPLVGTCRMLTPANAKRVGGFDIDRAFDLTRLRPWRAGLVEMGRFSVLPGWGSAGVDTALWSALAAFMQRNAFARMIGSARVGMRDGGHVAASLWEGLRHTHLAPVECHVTPRLPLPIEALLRRLRVEPPAPVKSSLSSGAKLLGPPAWDSDVDMAELPLMLHSDDLLAKHPSACC